MTPKSILRKLKIIKDCSRILRSASLKDKNKVLNLLSKKLKTEQESILHANSLDLNALPATETTAFRDRLTLNEKRLKGMQDSLQSVVDWPDPVGEIVDAKKLRTGLEVSKVRSPLGILFMIFESRPNVITEAFSLAFKSGNGFILKGGKESAKTSAILYRLIQESLQEAGFSKDVFWGLDKASRSDVHFLLQQKEYIDVVVPRGGEGLISFVSKNSPIPLIKNDRGLCHLYVHEDAELEMAATILENAKTQRPGVCNSVETLLLHQKNADTFLKYFYKQLQPYHVHWYCCPLSKKILNTQKNIYKAQAKNYATEYSDLILNVKIVKSLEEALAHIEKFGSKHSEGIVTRKNKIAETFLQNVDAAACYWNASTRFTDGYELGLGGELGISTQKLHVRGPVGLRELTSLRWVVRGNGHIRQ